MIMMRLLTGSGVKAAFTLSRSWAKLLQLAGAGDAAGLAALLKSQPKLQAIGSSETLWHEAARRGGVLVLSNLWRAGLHCEELRSTIDALNLYGESPLMAALKKGHGKAALWFLARGAQPLRWDALRRCSSIHLAARGGNEEACAALLDRLPESQRSLWANARSETCGVRPIHYAAAFGHAKVVRLLLQRGAVLTAAFQRCPPGGGAGADYHAQLEGRMVGSAATALHLAVVNNDMAVAAELLDHYMANADSLADPRLITNSPSPQLRDWHHNPSQLVSSNTLLLQLTRPGGNLRVLLANHPRGHFVPALAALAASAMRHSLVANIDAVEGEVEFRRSSLPQIGGGGKGGRRGSGGASGTTRQASLPTCKIELAGSGGGGPFRRSSLPTARVLGAGGRGGSSSIAGSGYSVLASSSSSGSCESLDVPSAADSGAATPIDRACVSRRGSLVSGADSYLLADGHESAASATSLTSSTSFVATFWRRTAGGGGAAAATAEHDGLFPKAAAATAGPAVFTAVCVAQALGADDAAMRLEGGGGDDDDEGSVTDEELRCSVCLCNEVELQVQGCRHRLCCDCMRAMAVRGGNVPLLCPLCRAPVKAVEAL